MTPAYKFVVIGFRCSPPCFLSSTRHTVAAGADGAQFIPIPPVQGGAFVVGAAADSIGLAIDIMQDDTRGSGFSGGSLVAQLQPNPVT